jgi:hypothetical protein
MVVFKPAPAPLAPVPLTEEDPLAAPVWGLPLGEFNAGFGLSPGFDGTVELGFVIPVVEGEEVVLCPGRITVGLTPVFGTVPGAEAAAPPCGCV